MTKNKTYRNIKNQYNQRILFLISIQHQLGHNEVRHQYEDAGSDNGLGAGLADTEGSVLRVEAVIGGYRRDYKAENRCLDAAVNHIKSCKTES